MPILLDDCSRQNVVRLRVRQASRCNYFGCRNAHFIPKVSRESKSFANFVRRGRPLIYM